MLENSALRQQLAVYERSVGRPNIVDRDRIFWLTVMRMLGRWSLASAPDQRRSSRPSATSGWAAF